MLFVSFVFLLKLGLVLGLSTIASQSILIKRLFSFKLLMKMNRKIALCLLSIGALCLSSCIRDEAPNSEADITACKVPTDILIREPLITNDKITFYVKEATDLTNQSPEFTLSEGATIVPASGTALNFTTPQTYVVTSQDGKWKKQYTVEYDYSEPLTQYHFENIKYYTDPDDATQKQYFQIFTDNTIDGGKLEWGSGNAGFLITHSNAAATDYPTCQADDGYIGKCAKLITCSTGALGAMFGAPIAAGNLFIGTFEVDLTNMAKSTHFGVPFRHTPKTLVGYYKYKAGDKFTDASNKEVAGKKDNFDIYAIFYEVTKDVPYLDGTNSLTSDNIVAIARLNDKKETDTWTRFTIPFNLRDGKTIDATKLTNGQYNIAIIMSSSIDGATFNGAVGSTLWVDEMQLFYE